MAAIDTLAEKIGREHDSERRVELLVGGLADLVKATSNDQNVQRLARELRASTPALKGALTASASAS